jgi:ankyrin repeat protein
MTASVVELRRDTEAFHAIVKSLKPALLQPYLTTRKISTGRWDVDIAEGDSRQTGLMLCVVAVGAPMAESYERRLNTAIVLLQLGANVHAQDWRGDTVLHHAIRTTPPRFNIIRRLLNAGALVTTKNLLGQTPLHCTVYEQTLVDLLLRAALFNSRGVDFHIKDARGNSPLHAAASSGGLLMATGLLAHGADPCGTNNHGQTPLHLVSRSTAGNTASMYSQQPDTVSTIEVLIRAGSPVSAKDDRGRDAVYYAATRGRHAGVVKLIVNGADAGSLPHGKLPKLLTTAVFMDKVNNHRLRLEAFMMGLKPRLGQISIVLSLDEEIARAILSLSDEQS